MPTGAIHGMVAMMKRLREQIGADYAACVFDAPGKNFRDEWYPEYKANRSSTAGEDLRDADRRRSTKVVKACWAGRC